MQNFLTWFLIIFLIIVIGVTSFLCGLYVGKNVLAKAAIEKEKQIVISNLSEKIKKLPGLGVIEAMPADIMHGRIQSISGKQIKFLAEPKSIDEILSDVPTKYNLNITDKTKIYYFEATDSASATEPTSITSLVTEKPLTADELKIDEQIAVVIDPAQIGEATIDALEIKVNR